MSTTSVLGETVVLTCLATAQPPPRYTWFRQQETEDQVVMNEMGSNLTFESVMASNRGAYFCNVSNELDNVTSPVALLAIEGM